MLGVMCNQEFPGSKPSRLTVGSCPGAAAFSQKGCFLGTLGHKGRTDTSAMSQEWGWLFSVTQFFHFRKRFLRGVGEMTTIIAISNLTVWSLNFFSAREIRRKLLLPCVVWFWFVGFFFFEIVENV